MKMRSLFLLCFLTIAGSLGVCAQNSMMPEVSYPLLTRMVQLAKDNYPRTKIFEKQVAIASTGVRQAKSGWLDVLNLAYMRTENLGATKTNAYMLNGYQYGLNINIGSLVQRPAQIKAAKQELQLAVEAQREYDKLIETLVKERYFTYIKQLTTVKLRIKSVQDTETVMKLALARFEKGEISYDNYNLALVAHTDQVQERIEAEASLLIAKAGLEELIGTTLEELSYWQSAEVSK